MSHADALLWTIGRDPVLRTTIVAVVMLDTSPRFDEVRSRMEGLTHVFPRLRSRVVDRPLGWGPPRWVADDRFDVDVHLRRMVAPPPASVRTVLDVAQVMATVGFDPAMALWEAVVVDGIEGDRAAFVVKLHHAVADGIGGIDVALGVLDRHRRPGPGEATLVPDRVAPRPTPHQGPGSPAGAVLAGATRALATTRHLLDNVVRAAASPVEEFGRAQATARSVARLMAPARRPLSPLMTPRSIGRHFEVLDLDAERLHAVASSEHCTVNDVFVTGILGGLRRYHEAHGVAVDELRVLMPVSVRKQGDASTGNHFVPARFTLPLVGDPVERLRRVREITGSWKHAPGLPMSDVLAAGLDLLPPPMATSVWGSMLKGDDFVATNVPGPPFETYLAGARVERFYAFAPPSGAALNVALVTPAGHACVALNLDTAAVPDGPVLAGCLGEGFAEVLGLGDRARRSGSRGRSGTGRLPGPEARVGA